MLATAATIESAAVKTGSRHKWSNFTRKVNPKHLINSYTGKPRTPNLDGEPRIDEVPSSRRPDVNNNVVEPAAGAASNQVSETVGKSAKAAESVETKGLLEMTGGSGMAMHGGAGIVSSAINSGVSVKTAKINQQTAEDVSENTLQGVRETNQTNKDIAVMQNNSNLQNQVVQGNAQASDPTKHDKLKTE